MPKTVEREEYLDTEELLTLFDASKKRFYSNIKPHLQVYHFDARKKPWYKKEAALALKNGRMASRSIITLPGILKDWTEYARSLGIPADTTNAGVTKTTLPEAAAFFHLDTSMPVAKRSRITLVNLVYICVWDTYYPLSLVEDDFYEIEHNFEYSVVHGIKARHGLVIGHTRERYSARAATFREQEQMQLITDEPILNLQRVSTTRDRKTLILYSDMALRGNWFAAEREYDVKIWDD